MPKPTVESRIIDAVAIKARSRAELAEVIGLPEPDLTLPLNVMVADELLQLDSAGRYRISQGGYLPEGWLA